MAKKNDRCAKCNKELLYFTLVLWMGPNGYRRYKLCDKCKAEIQPTLRADTKKAEPMCPTHGPQMKRVELTQGDVSLGHLWECKVEGCDECFDEDEVKEANPQMTQISQMEKAGVG